MEAQMKTSRLVSFTPLLINQLHRSWSNKYGTFYDFKLKFENNDTGKSSSKSKDGNYIIDQMYTYLIGLDQFENIVIKNLKKEFNHTTETEALQTALPLQNTPKDTSTCISPFRKILKLSALLKASESLKLLPEEEQNPKDLNELYKVFINYLDANRIQSKEEVDLRLLSLETALVLMNYPSFKLTSWDQVISKAHQLYDFSVK